MNEKISVALCTYNGAKYIQEQLNSIAAQSQPPDELVICDDGSSDGTWELVQKFRAPFAIKTYRNEQSLGVAGNFAKAIEHCSGDFIFLSDQDDVWKPQKIAILSQHLNSHPDQAAVFSNVELVSESLAPLNTTLWNTNRFTEEEQEWIGTEKSFSVFLRHNVAPGMSVAFRSSYKSQISPIPKDWIHDHWILLILSCSASIGAIAEPLVLYRQHGKQTLGASKEQGALARTKSAANTRDFSDLNLEILRFSQIADHLERVLPKNKADHVLQIQGKIAFFEERKTWPRFRVVRLVKLVSNWNKYYRYTAGISSLLKDLVRA